VDVGSLTCRGGWGDISDVARAEASGELTEHVSRFSGILASLSILLSLINTLTSCFDGEEGGMGSGARRCSLNGIT
jgi:hypothetical protein